MDNSGPSLTLWQAASRIVAGDDPQAVLLLANVLVAAAARGEIAAEPVAEPARLSLVSVISTGSTEPRARGASSATALKTLSVHSPVDFEEVCTWAAAKGYVIPERALALLPEPSRSRIAAARTVSTARVTQERKDTAILGVLLCLLPAHLPPGFRDGKHVNIAALGRLIRESVQDADGALPRGWGKSTIDEALSRAEQVAQSLVTKTQQAKPGSA
jgi:hypothetical protein